MNDAFQITFGLLGGLAIFIFGMNMMSESLQKAAGEKMKKILGILTVNPVMGVLAGAIATAVMQSSSATTVMVIGFVSAGLMSLKQGISVILGANIGTTMTAQLLAFNISDYIFVIISQDSSYPSSLNQKRSRASARPSSPSVCCLKASRS